MENTDRALPVDFIYFEFFLEMFAENMNESGAKGKCG